MQHPLHALPSTLLVFALLTAGCGSEATSSTAEGDPGSSAGPSEGASATAESPTTSDPQVAQADGDTGGEPAFDPTDPHAGHDHGPGEGHGAPQDAAPSEEDLEKVVAICNGEEIRARDVEDRLKLFVDSRTGGQPIPAGQMASIRQQYSQQFLQDLIDDRLLDAAAAEEGVSVTPEECRAELVGWVDAFLLVQGMDREEYAARLQETSGMTIDEFIDQRAQDPFFVTGLRHRRLLEKRYADDFALTDELVAEAYEKEKEQIWSQAENVRAAHILFQAQDGDEADAQARAEEVLALAQAEGADFAALAREHSDGPSGPGGGDLGFFPRQGKMVEPFAAAAFELAVGEVSELVKTQFGLHIIKVLDRRAAKVVPLEEAAPVIRRNLLDERINAARQRQLLELRGNAEIEVL